MHKNTTVVDVQGRKTHCLLDTGAMITCCSSDFFKKLSHDNKLCKSEYFSVTGVGGTRSKVLGKVKLPLSFKGTVFHHFVHVVEGLQHSLIIGIDFMQQHGVQLDLATNIMHLPNTPKICTLQTSAGLARNLATVTIPPQHECNIGIQISKRNSGDIVLLEPVNDIQGLNLMTAKCLVKINNKKSVIRVLNPTNKPVTLPASKVLATVADIHEESIQELNDEPSKETNVNTIKTGSDKHKTHIDFDLQNADLTAEQKHKLTNFLNSNRDVFATSLSELGHSNVYKHKIETFEDARPVSRTFYPQSPPIVKEIDRQVDEMQKDRIIIPSNSEYHSPVVLVKKKSGEMRFAVDYRKLNKITKPMAFPLPRLECVFDTIGESQAQIFSSLDLHSGFWQIEMDESTRHKAAFITRNGVYEWLRMPFGLRNAPISFQMIMTQVLRGLNWKFVLVYVDDILVFSKSFEEHLWHLEQVFNRLRDANLTLKPSKCVFAAKEVKYLGHIISKHGVHVDPSKTEAVSNFPVPKTQKQVKSFLGMCSYYRKFVENFSKIASPLNALLRKDCEKKIQWTHQCQEAFDKLKHALLSAPILAYPDMNKPFMLTCDASKTAIGFVLGQLDSQGREHVIAYGGRSLSKAERNWCTTEQECLAVVEGIKHFRTYLTRRFKIFTDHKALKYLMDQKEAVGKLGRWSLKLMDYDFEIIHKPGKMNEVADALSRRQYTELADEANNTSPVKVYCADAKHVEIFNCQVEEESERVELELFYDEYPVLAPLDPEILNSKLSDMSSISRLQKQDPDFHHVYKYLVEDIVPKDEKKRQKVLAEAQDFSVCDGVLYKWFQKRFKAEEGEKYIKQLCLPTVLRHDALTAFHDTNFGGAHLGVDRVLAALRQKYYWPKMHQTVKDHILSCDRCQRIKVDNKRKNPPLTPLPIVGPFERWHMDFLKLSKTKDGYQYLFIMVDSFTKWVEAFPMRSQEASEVAKIIFSEIFARYGAPRVLVSDRGKSFMSTLVLSLCEVFNVTRHHTSSYHPQTNGLVERTNSTLIKSFRAYCDKDQNNWPRKLPGILMAIRNSPATQSTEFSPFHLLFGREMNLPFDTSVLPKQSVSADAKLQLEEVLSNLKITQDLATENIKQKQAKAKERHDRNSKIPQFQLRDLVLLRQHVVPVGRSPKLVDKYKGPYYITELGPNYTYKLRLCKDNKEVKSMINARELILYKDPRDHQMQPNEDVQQQNIVQEGGHNQGDENNAENGKNRGNVQEAQQQSNVQEAQNKENANEGNGNNEGDEQFFPAEKLLKVKRMGGKKHFLVKWSDGSKPTWEPEEYVSDYLIRKFFTTHTNAGKRRKRRTCLQRQ